MAECKQKNMDFVSMTTIGKTTDDWDERCTDWVATEKVHGSSFQFYTDDGLTIHTGSRRRNLDAEDSFLKCNIHVFLEEYRGCVVRMWNAIISDDRWNRHRDVPKQRENSTNRRINTCQSGSSVEFQRSHYNDNDNNKEESKCVDKISSSVRNAMGIPGTECNEIESCLIDKSKSSRKSGQTTSDSRHHHKVSEICNPESHGDQSTRGESFNDIQEKKVEMSENMKDFRDEMSENMKDVRDKMSENMKDVRDEMSENMKVFSNIQENSFHQSREEILKFQLRIYGELYGGGGVDRDTKQAIQKDIIYCDNFRFYVFGITINRRWLTISELGSLCEAAGFPYYAKPVNEVPMQTVDELKCWLDETGLMRNRSTLTERKDDKKTHVEGYVLTPLTKSGYGLHAIKYLAPSFNDVRTKQSNLSTKIVYCTKQRYNSVISKLDEKERRDTDMVIAMMVEDILAESQGTDPSKKEQKVWRRMTVKWLREDGYSTLEEEKMQNRGKRVGEKMKEEEGEMDGV